MLAFLSHLYLVADPRGRVNRKGLLGVAIALLSVQALAILGHWLETSQILHFVIAVFEVGSLWIATSAAIKRLHDLGYSGWWVPGSILALFVWTLVACFATLLTFGEAVANVGSPGFMVYASAVMFWPLAATFWLHFAPGENGANRYGPEPDETGISMPSTYAAAPLVSAQVA